MQVFAHNCIQAAVGQLELICKDSVFTSWANASISPSRHPAHWKVCGPRRQSHTAAHCVPDGPMRAFILVVIPLIGKYVGTHDSLMQQPTVCPMGQCEHLAR